MKQKSLGIMAVVVLAVTLFRASMIGTVTANRGQTMKQYVNYELNAVLSSPITTVVMNPPMLIVDGYRPASGIQSCVITINGEDYVYPDDFQYSENFHLEMNTVTHTGTITVKTVFTFNFPGNPTITEWVSGTAVNTPTSTEFDGTFYLTGTKMFTPVDGGGIMDSYGMSGTDYATHTGLIKGWIFD